MAPPRPAKKPTKQLDLPAPAPSATTRVLPMHLKPGDRLTDSTGEWEVVGRPDVTDIRTSCAHERVRVKELYEYLEQQVTRKSRAVGGNQHPVMKGELEGVLPLTKIRSD